MFREGVTITDLPNWRRAADIGRVRERLRLNWVILFVLGCFGLSAFIVPTLAPVATTDDWGYTRSVEILLNDGRLTVLPAVAASSIFQILWGALFGSLFGLSLGVMRISTVVAVALGGVALYALCRELGINRDRSALGVATYLFNPLAFALAFTFMSDPHFTTWLIVATLFYLRGVKRENIDRWNIIGGSAAAAAALLVRQQGVLIPLAVAAALFYLRQIRVNRQGVYDLLKIGGIPAVALAAYSTWLRFGNGVPGVQKTFLREVRDAGMSGTWHLIRSLTVIDAMYIGFFVVPIVVAAVPALRAAIGSIQPGAALAFALLLAVLAAGVTHLTERGQRMPYIPQFVGSSGLGPPDVLGSRPRLFHQPFFDIATVFCFIAAAGVGLFMCRAIAQRHQPAHRGAILVLALLLGQVIGILLPSYHYLHRNLSLDRYLLPLLPLSIALILWALRDLRIFRPVAWTIVALFAVFSVTATHDYLSYMSGVWNVAAEAQEAGVTNTRLDAGAAWDGYHLYTYGLEHHITASRSPRRLAWWFTFYAKPTNADYVVSSKLIPWYRVIWVRHYRTWLPSRSTTLYLLERVDVTGPPCLQPTGQPANRSKDASAGSVKWWSRWITQHVGGC